MNLVLKIFLSMSFSGALLILALLWGKQFFKNFTDGHGRYDARDKINHSQQIGSFHNAG